MKCAKCDYVSFDYLSECKNCHASMEAVRARFRFPAAKPKALSLLGSLLSAPTAEVEHPPAAAQSPISDDSSLEQESAITFDEGFQIDSVTTGEEFSATDATNEDFSLLDISDEELGTLIVEHDEFGKGQREDNPSPGKPQDSLSEHSDISAALELDLGDFLERKDGKIDSGADLQGEPEKLDAATKSPPPEAQALAGSDDDFLIDLSEGDLDNFLQQLEQTKRGKA
ncbi:MAG: hypothetical protein ACP5IL_12810 [Syntrophobacteraceae bacterium]